MEPQSLGIGQTVATQEIEVASNEAWIHYFIWHSLVKV